MKLFKKKKSIMKESTIKRELNGMNFLVEPLPFDGLIKSTYRDTFKLRRELFETDLRIEKELRKLETMKHKKQIIELLKDIRSVNIDIDQELNFGSISKGQSKRDYWIHKLNALYPNLLGDYKYVVTYGTTFRGLVLIDFETRKEVTFDNI